MRIVTLKNVFITRSGIGLKNFQLIDETVHQYKGKRKHFWRYALLQFFFRKKVRLAGEYFLIHNHWCPGYYHWITEALPRLWKIRDQVSTRTLLLPETFRNAPFSSIEPFYQGKVYWIPVNRNLRVENLLVPENPPFSGVYDKETFVGLRKKFNSFRRSKDTLSPPNNRIYVSRARANRRKVVNEEAVISFLMQHDFKIVHFEDYGFWEQVEMMQQTRILVSIHGAGLSNILFMPEGGHLIELQKKVTRAEEEIDVLYRDFAHVLDIDYKVLFCEHTDENATIYHADIIVNLERLKAMLTF